MTNWRTASLALVCAAAAGLAACQQPAAPAAAPTAEATAKATADAPATAATGDAAGPVTAFTAYGEDWRGVVDGDKLTLSTGPGSAEETLTVTRSAYAKGAEYTAGDTVLVIDGKPCTDTAGQQVEFTATLTYKGKPRAKGCAVRGATPIADT